MGVEVVIEKPVEKLLETLGEKGLEGVTTKALEQAFEKGGKEEVIKLLEAAGQKGAAELFAKEFEKALEKGGEAAVGSVSKATGKKTLDAIIENPGKKALEEAPKVLEKPSLGTKLVDAYAKHPVAIPVAAVVLPPAAIAGYHGYKFVDKVGSAVNGAVDKVEQGFDYAVDKLKNVFNGHSDNAPPDVMNVLNEDGTPNLDEHGNPVKGREQSKISYVAAESDFIKDNKTGKPIMGKDGKPLVKWNPAEEEPGMVDNFCKWIYDHTQGWDPTLQRIAFAAVPLIGAVIGAFAMPGIASLLGIGMALLAAWQGPEFVASHANVVTQHDDWVKTHPAKPFNNAAAGTTEPEPKPQQQPPRGLLTPQPAH